MVRQDAEVSATGYRRGLMMPRTSKRLGSAMAREMARVWRRVRVVLWGADS